MAAKRTIAVSILGQEYRIRSDAEEDSVQRAASLVDETMATVRDRAGTVDSLNIAVLGALNIANQLISLRDRFEVGEDAEPIAEHRIRDLVAFVESIMPAEDAG